MQLDKGFFILLEQLPFYCHGKGGLTYLAYLLGGFPPFSQGGIWRSLSLVFWEEIRPSDTVPYIYLLWCSASEIEDIWVNSLFVILVRCKTCRGLVCLFVFPEK